MASDWDFVWKQNSKTGKILAISIIILICCIIVLLLYIGVHYTISKKGKKDGSILSVDRPVYQHFPYVAMIQIVDSNSEKIKCLGAILSNKEVLTLAQCVQDIEESKLRVIIGLYDVDYFYGSIFKINKISIHPEYISNKNNDYNIAILHLTKDIYFDDFTCKIHIMVVDDICGKILIHGWGKNLEKYSTKNTTEMKTTSIYIKSLNEETSYPCDGPQCDDICIGNLGSPIVQEIYYKPTLVGIVTSPDYPCHKDSKKPGILKISKLKNWIDSKGS